MEVKTEKIEQNRDTDGKFNEEPTVFDCKIISTENTDPLPLPTSDIFDLSKFTCDYCGQHFNRKSSIGSHMSIHKPEITVENESERMGCGKTDKTRKSFKKLRLRTNEKKLKVHIEANKKVKYCCTQCPKRFEVEHKLGAHIRSAHQGLKAS